MCHWQHMKYVCLSLFMYNCKSVCVHYNSKWRWKNGVEQNTTRIQQQLLSNTQQISFVVVAVIVVVMVMKAIAATRVVCSKLLQKCWVAIDKFYLLLLSLSLPLFLLYSYSCVCMYVFVILIYTNVILRLIS